MKFQPKLYYKIRSYKTSKVELLQFIKTQLEITDTNFRQIHEDNRSLPNDAHLNSKFKICEAQLIKRQLEITNVNFQRIYEDNRGFPNGTDLKFKFKIFNMGVDFI